MWAVTIDEPGAPAALGWAEVADPVPGPGEVLIEVAAGGRQPGGPAAGGRALPAAAGRVADPWHGVLRDHRRARSRGHRLAGRRRGLRAAGRRRLRRAGRGAGRAGAAGARRASTWCTPPACPRSACTVWSNLVLTAGLRAGQTVLIHGGGSGIGTMAIQVASAPGRDGRGHRVPAPRRCRPAANSAPTSPSTTRKQDFVAELPAATDGRGADVILDVVGAKYLARNICRARRRRPAGRHRNAGRHHGRAGPQHPAAQAGGVIATALRSRPVTGPGSEGRDRRRGPRAPLAADRGRRASAR